jgi:superfamily II DNA or RNA helicase
MIRASRIARANELLEKYRSRGVNAAVVHSGVGVNVRARTLADLRAGNLRAVAVVGMLSEGFDLPSLRILAYHDKYKSLPATDPAGVNARTVSQ